MEGEYLQTAMPAYEKDDPWPEAFTGSLVSDVSLALHSEKEEPEEQAKGKDDKNKARRGVTVSKMAHLLQFFN